MAKLKNPTGEIWGYARVSTKEQHEDRQLIALEEYGVDSAHIFLDKQSGKNFNRPAYKRLIRIIRKGDIIVIKSIDRLGRDYQDIIDQWRMITQDIGCGIHVVDMPMLNTSGDPEDLLSRFITDMMLQVLSFVAQNERENTINRQKEGIEAAKRRRNVKIGRPKKKMPFDFWEIFIMWKTEEYHANDLWRYCHETWGMSNRTFYRRLNELDQRYGDFTPDQLRRLILDKEFVDGIEYDNERIEQGIGYYNPYVLHNPEVAKEQKKKRKEKYADLTPEEEEAELKKIILARRQQEFKDRFGIDDTELFDMTVDKKTAMDDEMPTQLIRRKKPNGTSFTHVVNNHKKGSGYEDAISLEDESTIIPDVDDRIDPQKPMKTIVIV